MVKKPWCEQLTEGEKIMELRPIPFSNFVYGEQIFFVEVGSGGRIIGSAEFQGRVRIRNKEWFQRWYPKHRCIDMPDYRKLYGLYFATPKRLTDPIFTKRSGLGHSQTHGSLEPDDVKMKGVIPDQVHFVTPVTYFQISTQKTVSSQPRLSRTMVKMYLLLLMARLLPPTARSPGGDIKEKVKPLLSGIPH
jgi:hypothetical protein